MSSVFEAAIVDAAEAVLIAELRDEPPAARIVFVNRAFEERTGFGPDDAIGRDAFALLCPGDGAAEQFDRSVRAGVTARAEGTVPCAGGTNFWAEVHFKPLQLHGDGTFTHLVATVRDITDRQRVEQTLAHAATHDPLTGLPNRVLLLERLDAALDRQRLTTLPLAVLFVDIDRFKLVNDSLGHEIGDDVIRRFAERVRASVRGGDVVARFGGDEVVVLCETTTSVEANRLAARIMQSVGEPMHVRGRDVFVSASIGLALGRRSSAGPEQLLRDADHALYEAKQKGRARVEPFNADLRARAARRFDLESQLRTAVRDHQLELWYQPQVDLATGRLVGVEALVRWNHPARGLVSPAEFVPIAEETGLIVPMGRWILFEACRQLAAWRARVRHAPASITVNVSSRQLQEPDFTDDVRSALAGTVLTPSAVCLELTEGALMDSDGTALDALREVQRIGVYVGADDFGTGHSSLGRLRDLPVEVLKIDRSFVGGLGREPGDTAIVASIMSLSAAMGLHVIAEGVEHPDQVRALQSLGCRVAQGFLFARPQPAAAIPGLCGRRLWRPPHRWSPGTPADEPGDPPARRRGRLRFIDEFLEHIGATMEPFGEKRR
jgi:diguanylate cyclase (GGDEF)-like protein/PAS domain S-box-containing protein